MNKNRILAVLCSATVLSGCALAPTPLHFSSAPTNSPVQVNTDSLGQTLMIRVDQPLSAGDVNYPYVIDRGLGDYIASRVHTTSPVAVDVLMMTIKSDSQISQFDSTCSVAYNINGKGVKSDYQYVYSYDTFNVSPEDLGYGVVTPCLDRFAEEIQVYADSL